MADLPEPLVPADVDLTGFPSFGLNVERLLASELVALCTAEEGWAAVMLWARAWQQTPPGSLPNDERVLAAFSRAKNWKRVREMALRGFVLCSDGRLYHPMLAAEALRCWQSRLKHQEDKVKNAEKLRSWREKQREKNQAQTGDVTGYADGTETGSVTGYETGKRGKGIGEGEKTLNPVDKQQHNHLPQSRAVERHVEIAVLLRSLGVSPMTGSHPMAMQFANEGATDQHLRAAVDIARERKPAPEPISPNYLRPILADVMNPQAPRPTTSRADARAQERADVIATLTGRKQAHERTPDTVDVVARRVD